MANTNQVSLALLAKFTPALTKALWLSQHYMKYYTVDIEFLLVSIIGTMFYEYKPFLQVHN